MKQYLNSLRYILEHGEVRENRTGVNTIAVFGHQERFKLAEGFPATTTKKLAWKSIVSELLWFLEGSGDERRLAEIRFGGNRLDLNDKKTIWTANAEAGYWKEKAKYKGDLGRVYGNMWRKWPGNPEVIKSIPRRTKECDTPITYSPILKTPEENINEITGNLPRENNAGHKFNILNSVGTINGNTHYTIQFIETGYTAIVSRPNLRSKTHRDWFERMQSGVGVYGQEKNFSPTELEKRIYYLWDNMISRCYDVNHPQYKFYGGMGVTVSTKWQNFATFQHSIKNVPGFYEWCSQEKIELDKDYFGANQYSESTTLFLHKSFNQEIAKGKFPEDQKTVTRRIFYIDQIANIIDTIKNNPQDRRIILNAWNPGELDQMALPPCHLMAQFNIRQGKYLDCQMYQRSADAPLGVPFNIASYALLTHMIAHVTGLEAGDFIHTFGDLHIYENQISGVKEQLSRTPLELPTLWLNPDIKNIDDFTMDDLKLIDYNHHPEIKFPFAV